MAIFAFHPALPIDRRPDGIGFVLAEGTDEAAARTAAQALVGGRSIAAWSAVPVVTGVPAVAVQGIPVGAKSQATWPNVTRGGGFLGI